MATGLYLAMPSVAKAVPVCGNGIVEDFPTIEECDDGGIDSGDGCSATCQLEDGSFGNECLKQKTGLNNPSCSAGDVRISYLELGNGPQTCIEGTYVTVPLVAIIESGTDARNDIGIWVNEYGNSAKDDTTGDNCWRDYLDTTDNDNCNGTSVYYSNPVDENYFAHNKILP